MHTKFNIFEMILNILARNPEKKLQFTRFLTIIVIPFRRIAA